MSKGNTPEGKVKTAVKKILAKYPESRFRWPVPYGYGLSELDCYGCHYGQYVSIETKAPGEKPTARQERDIKDTIAAGGTVFVIDGDPAQLAELKEYLQEVKQHAITGLNITEA